MQRPSQNSIHDPAASRPAGRLSILLRAIEVWLVISAVEVVHGVARTTLLEPIVGDFPARQIAVFSGSAIIIATTFIFMRWLSPASTQDCLMIGTAWVVMTLAFELILGRFVMDLTWERIFSDYDLIRGGLMPLGLVVMLISPLIVFRLRRQPFTTSP